MIGDTNVCRVLFVALWVASHALHVARDRVRQRASRERKETRTVAVVYGYVGCARNGYVFDSSAAQAAILNTCICILQGLLSKYMYLCSTCRGTQLEVCWGLYKATEDNSNVKMWCPCKVLRVADGDTDKGRDGQALSAGARKLAPRGMVLVEWEPDPERGETESTTMWLLLDPRPGKWNGDGHRAWRYHSDELAAIKRAAREKPAPAGAGKKARV